MTNFISPNSSSICVFSLGFSSSTWWWLCYWRATKKGGFSMWVVFPSNLIEICQMFVAEKQSKGKFWWALRILKKHPKRQCCARCSRYTLLIYLDFFSRWCLNMAIMTSHHNYINHHLRNLFGVFFLSSKVVLTLYYMVVSNILYLHRSLGKWSNLTSIFFRWVGSTTK